jgi:hypothetical protein
MNVVLVSSYASAVMRAGFACSVTETYRHVFERLRDDLPAREQLFKSLKVPPTKYRIEPGETTVSDRNGRSKLSVALILDC